ncbi:MULTISPECIES: hypothetical protein [Microbacterium]|uniref:hypothetical protein n=1 Tax=Microbacterium TaxID=33882 RepID=UPI0028F01D63|nr:MULTISPECIES: hypothetical protein [Microbacterium]
MMSARHRRIARLTAPLLIVGFLLSACTPAEEEPAPTPTAADGAPQIPGEDKGVVGATSVPEDVPDAPEVRAGTQITTCTTEDDGGTATGVVGNPTDEDATYVVTVFFTTDAATVVGSGQATVEVPAGEEADWSLTADFVPPSDLRCALRGAGAAS